MEKYNIAVIYVDNRLFTMVVFSYSYLGAMNQFEAKGKSLCDPLIKEVIIRKLMY